MDGDFANSKFYFEFARIRRLPVGSASKFRQTGNISFQFWRLLERNITSYDVPNAQDLKSTEYCAKQKPTSILHDTLSA